MYKLLCIGCTLLLSLSHGLALAKPLIVHEWGTFTSFQDEQGRSIGGINVDDEPVPKFVKRIKDQYVVERFFDKPWFWSQGAISCFKAVTMRLETPVIYFYPEKGTAYKPFDVKVDFKQGWLTEYFPVAAKAQASGFPDRLTNISNGSLQWSNVQLDNKPPSQQTTEHVWLAPRKVSAASVTVDKETEKYLFYRGVAQLDAPIKVVRRNNKLFVYSQLDKNAADRIELRRLWLVDILPDGRTAYREFGPIILKPNAESLVISIDAGFNQSEYSNQQLHGLKQSMQQALEHDGLYPDEAKAMLETWKLSYFKSGGTRLFFTVPKVWTDYYLPLQVSIPTEIKRVMVGRLELLNPRQRASLDKIANLPSAKDGINKVNQAFIAYLEKNKGKTDAEELTDMWRMPIEDYARKLDVELPESFRLFLDLGRFRDALIPYAYDTYRTDTFKDFPTSCYYRVQQSGQRQD